MKRWSTLLLAALLCLTLAVPALADTGAMLVRNDIKDARWIYNTSLLRVPGSDGYSMNAVDGTALTGALYTNLDGAKGYIVAAQVNADPVNAFGVFDATGKEMVPFKYGDVRMESSEWALGVVLTGATADNYDYKNSSGDAFYAIQSVDVYHLPEGNLLETLARDQFLDADAVNHCLNIQDRATSVISCYDAGFNQVGTDLKYLTSDDYAPADYQYFRENGQTGIQDAAGNVIMAPAFQSVNDCKRGYFQVSTGDKVGLVDMNGNVVVPAEYEKIKSTSYAPVDGEGGYSAYVAGGYVCVVQDGKLGFVDLNGNVTSAPTYGEKNFDSNYGMSATLMDLEGKTHIVSADGADTVVEGFERIYCLDYTAGAFFKVYNGDKYGVVDWHGKEILPCQYDSVYTSADGQYVLVSVDYDHYELYQLTYPTAGEAGAAPAEEAPAADRSAVKSLLDSAVTLLNADAAANRDAVIGLLNSAIASLGEGDEAVTGLLNSAIMLLNADAASNATSVVTILVSASGMLQ